MPHVQITGNADELQSAFVDKLDFSKFPNLAQLVLRFNRLTLMMPEIYQIRRNLSLLPAVCISKQFIVALRDWAGWWPPMTEIWSKQEQVSGISIFKEQIDFSSFYTSGDREWLRLKASDKLYWNETVTTQIKTLFQRTKQVPKPRRRLT
jgi:hypothetical protein